MATVFNCSRICVQLEEDKNSILIIRTFSQFNEMHKPSYTENSITSEQ